MLSGEVSMGRGKDSDWVEEGIDVGGGGTPSMRWEKEIDTMGERDRYDGRKRSMSMEERYRQKRPFGKVEKS